MSLVIPFPFIEYTPLLHSLGFRFVLQETQGWVNFKLNRKAAEKILPEVLLSWMSDHTSMMDFLDRNEGNSKLNSLLGEYEPEDYLEWKNTTEEQSLKNANIAQDESLYREEIVKKIQQDFNHPKLDIGQGRGSDKNKLSIRGTLSTYKIRSINSLFYSMAHFLVMSPSQLAKREVNHCINQNNPNFESIALELKILALADTMSIHYGIPCEEKDFFFSAIAEYEGCEQFFSLHMHLVPEFSNYDEEDKQWADFSAEKIAKEESISKTEALEMVTKGQSGMLHFRHKKQVLQAYFDQKLTNKYTMDHIRFMFEQQLPYLK